MTTPDAITAAALAFGRRWHDWIAAHPDHDETAVRAAMQRGELPPGETAVSPPASFPFPVPNYNIFELSPLGYAYHALLAEGWTKAQALYMAWEAHPKELRARCGLPQTKIEFFTKILRYKSDNALRQWRMKYNGEERPSIDERINSLVRESHLGSYRPAVMYALAEGAAVIGENFGDRKLFLEMTGDYKPGAKGTEDDPIHLQPIIIKMDVDEL